MARGPLLTQIRHHAVPLCLSGTPYAVYFSWDVFFRFVWAPAERVCAALPTYPECQALL